jgi:predicted DNA-binding transcriptional regulator AlpA
MKTKKLITVKEAIAKYDLSKFAIYEHIKTDPSFPAINIGPYKNYRLNEALLKAWIDQRLHFKPNDSFIKDVDVLLNKRR